jgi:hypothetical protein
VRCDQVPGTPKVSRERVVVEEARKLVEWIAAQ